MDSIYRTAREEVKEPSVFFSTVHEMMQDRETLTLPDLLRLESQETGNARINETAKVLNEHFEDIRQLSAEPKKLDSTFGDSHNR